MSSLLSIKSSVECLNGNFNNKRHLWCLLKFSGPLRTSDMSYWMLRVAKNSFWPLYCSRSCQHSPPLLCVGKGLLGERSLCGQRIVSQWTLDSRIAILARIYLLTFTLPWLFIYFPSVTMTAVVEINCLILNRKHICFLCIVCDCWRGRQFQPSSLQDIFSEMLYDNSQLLSSSALTLAAAPAAF